MASSSSTTSTGFFDNQNLRRRIEQRPCQDSLEPRAAVDVDCYAVEIIGHRRGQEENHGGDVADRADAAERDLPNDVVVVRVELASRHLRGDEAGGDAAGHDVVLGAATGDGAGEVDERRLGGAVVRELRLAAERRARGDV